MDLLKNKTASGLMPRNAAHDFLAGIEQVLADLSWHVGHQSDAGWSREKWLLFSRPCPRFLTSFSVAFIFHNRAQQRFPALFQTLRELSIVLEDSTSCPR